MTCFRTVLAGAMFVSACATAPPVPVPPLSRALAVDMRELCRRPETLFGATRDSMKTKLGEPRQIVVNQIPNRHVRGVVDRRVTLDFGNIEVVLHEVPEYGSSFLAQTRLTGNDPRLDVPLEIGHSVGEVRSLLGAPRTETSEKLEYDCRWELSATLNVYLDRRGRVRLIEWITEPD